MFQPFYKLFLFYVTESKPQKGNTDNEKTKKLQNLYKGFSQIRPVYLLMYRKIIVGLNI